MIPTDRFINGIPIIITTMKSKVRHHKKRRIRKKWAKQQLIFDIQHDGEVVLANGCYYMNENTFNQYMEHFTKKRKETQDETVLAENKV